MCLDITIEAKSTLMSYDQYWALNICSPQLVMSPEWSPSSMSSTTWPWNLVRPDKQCIKKECLDCSPRNSLLKLWAGGSHLPGSEVQHFIQILLWAYKPWEAAAAAALVLLGAVLVGLQYLVIILCISYHSQSFIFVSKQAEGRNLSSKGLQSTSFIYLLTHLLI